MSGKLKKIGVLTSGGDAPGMNAAIRAVVRTALYHEVRVVGIKRGYDGLLSGEIEKMSARSVSDIIDRGGTILKTARCEEMMTSEGQDKAAQICNVLGLDTLVVIGGDGSFRGAQQLSKRGVKVCCIPATIDLDIDCTEYSIGFDTAVNSGMKAITKIRDTSSSHERCSVVEVMGRHAGYIALWCGMSTGAEEVLIPELEPDVDSVNENAVIQQIIENRAKGKEHNLIVVAEGIGGSIALAKDVERVTGIETRATVLGHLQRGGSPTAVDRVHASIMGYTAITSLIDGNENFVVVYKSGKHETMPLDLALSSNRSYDNSFYEMVKILSI